MTATTARDRLVVQQRSEAVRSWTRLDTATGSLTLLDPDIEPRSALVGQMRAVGIHVQLHTDHLKALVCLGAHTPDVVVVSTAMPAQDLRRFVEVVRSELSVPVLLALGAGDTDSIGPAVAAGALPAVSRPYRFEDFLRELQPHWPRQSGRGERVTVGDLQLDIDGYDAHLGAVGVDFTTAEFELLTLLAQSPDRVVLRDSLARRFWPSSPDPDAALVATVARIRRKLAAVGAPDAIHTVRGVGYRLEAGGLRA